MKTVGQNQRADMRSSGFLAFVFLMLLSVAPAHDGGAFVFAKGSVGGVELIDAPLKMGGDANSSETKVGGEIRQLKLKLFSSRGKKLIKYAYKFNGKVDGVDFTFTSSGLIELNGKIDGDYKIKIHAIDEDGHVEAIDCTVSVSSPPSVSE